MTQHEQQVYPNQVKRQLYEWQITQEMYQIARKHGMSDSQFSQFWDKFVTDNLTKRNSYNMPVLTDIHRARLRAFLALRDAGWPSPYSRIKTDPAWRPATVTTKSGKRLDWKVYTNNHHQAIVVKPLAPTPNPNDAA